MDNAAFIERVGIELPDDEVGLVRCHQSGELTVGQRRILAVRENLGLAVMTLAYLTYLYAVERVGDKGRLSNLSRPFSRHASEELCRRLDLEPFIILGSSAQAGDRHLGMGQKLVASVYKVHGFHAAYDLLAPSFGTTPTMPDGAYKTLVQEYSQARNLTVEYTTKWLTGPKDHPRFSSTVRVGKRVATGVGGSKKAAEAAAAKAYCERNHIRVASKKQARIVRPRTSSSVARERAQELERAAIALGLPQASLSLKQFDICLTHVSYTGEHPECINNDCLKSIGATVMEMLCLEYVEERYDPERIDLVGEKTLLLKERSLARAVPQGTLGALRVGRSLSNSSNYGPETLEADIAKGVAACIFMNYAASKKEAESVALQTLATMFLDRAASEIVPEYRTITQEIVQSLHASYREEYQRINEHGHGGREGYRARVTVSGTAGSITREGMGTSRHASRDAALKEMMPTLISWCPEGVQKTALSGRLQTNRRRLQLSEAKSDGSSDMVRHPPVARSNGRPVAKTGLHPTTKETVTGAAAAVRRAAASVKGKRKGDRGKSVGSTRVEAIKADAPRVKLATQSRIRDQLDGWSEKEINAVKRIYGEYGLYASFWKRVLNDRSEREILTVAMLLGVISSGHGSVGIDHDMELVEFFRAHSLVDELRRRDRRLPEQDMVRAVELCLYDKMSDFKWKSNRRDFSSNSGMSVGRHGATESYKPPTRDNGHNWDSWDSYIFEQ